MSSAEDSDALSALAPLLRVSPELDSFCQFDGDWRSPHEPEKAQWVPFHMVTAGTCTLDIPGEPETHLDAGDIVLLPQGDAHILRGRSDGRPSRRPAAIQTRTTGVIEVRFNTDRPEAELLCGRLTFEQPGNDLIRATLPRMILVKTRTAPANATLQQLLTAIQVELNVAAPGARAICRDLASALLVMVLRTYLQRYDGCGLLRLLGNRHTARAVSALMKDPARDWSLDAMAASAHMSRATLVRTFRGLADDTPFGVLAEIRLALARQSLRESDRPLADIAAEVGFQSASAFSRAFQRRFHHAPGAVRLKAG